MELADQIGNALKLPNCNLIETSELRRNKFLMQEKLKEEKKAREITLQMYEVEIRRNIGRQGMEKIKRKAEQKLKREQEKE